MANKRNMENWRKSISHSHKQQADKPSNARRGAERYQSERCSFLPKIANRGTHMERRSSRGSARPAHGRADSGHNGRRGPFPKAACKGALRQHPQGGRGTSTIPLAGRRKGDWYEIRLPEQYSTISASNILRLLPIPPKLASKLLQENGVQISVNLLKLRLFSKERTGIEADWYNLNVLFEDDFMLIVNKPAGMEVHPSTHGQKGTLANAVAAYFEMTGKACKVRPIHRLDKDTTGPVVFAKNEVASIILEKSLKDKNIDRLYVAIAEGSFSKMKGTIDAPIGQDRLHSTRRRVSETGLPAVTHYEVAEQLGEHTLVRLRLTTGRTHQIRVHLSHIGHPIAGDGMYGGKRIYISRQALHGERLIYNHPWTGKKIHVSAPIPQDMRQALEALRNR
ncbi:RluA family pseudouridine synthase [Paenibacillus jamilae]|uniref:RluA family pseudouridine synthase n=1 Tax=Paenibacillus jamilae TaxID=114136 RepID=UPI003D286CBB